MTLRATRQMVEVLAAGSGGKARVSRQCVEILSSMSLYIAEVNDVLALTEEATTALSGHWEVMELAEEVTANIERSRGVAESMEFGEAIVVHGPIYVEVHHVLHFEEDVYGHNSTINVTVAETVDFQETVGRVIHVMVSEAIDFEEAGAKENKEVVHETLAFSQTLTAGKSKGIHETLDLIQTVTIHGTFSRTVTESLGLQQACTCWIEGPRRFERQYYPFVGDGGGSPTPPPLALNTPLEGITAPFQLVYPAAGDVTDSCTLRAPNFGNRDRLSFNRINRETRGGTLVVYADPIWPKMQTLVLSFSGLRRSEGLDLLEFLSDHLGQEIGLIDWESRYWRGIVTTTTDPVIEDSHDSFSANFEFDGALDPSWSPQVIPVAPGTPRRRVKSELRNTPDPMEPIPPVVPTTESYSAEADAAFVIGQPLYLKAIGHADLARANAIGMAGAIGFAITAAEPTDSVNYVTEGKLTLTDWTAVAGAVALVAGTIYYLDAASAGQITSTAPTTAGQYVVRLGRATSATTLDIEIEAPVGL